jgi:phage terminase small subunit
MAERQERTQVTQDEVVRELAALAFSDVRHYTMDDLGHLEPVAGAPANASRAIQSVKYKSYTRDDVTTREAEYRLWSKTDALKALANHIGMHTDKVAVTGPGGGPIQHAIVSILLPDNGRGDRPS